MNNTNRMRNQRWALESTTSLYPQVNQVPGLETLILMAVTNSALFGLGPAAVSAITTGLTSLATTAIVTGLQYLFMPKPPKPADGKAPKVQAVPPIIFGVGTNRIAGFLMLWEEVNNKLCTVSALCGHKISAISKHYLHDDVVTSFDGEDFVTGTEVDDGRYTGHVRIQTRLGANPETAYAPIVDLLGSQDIWTNDHRGDGQASLGMICHGSSQKNFGTKYPYGIVQPSVEADLALVWDFRDEDQDPEDETTWTFSKNPALCFVWWLCFCEFGPKWDYTTAILPVLERWQEEADICDETVATAVGGTEPRYEVNGWGTSETDPIAILNAFLASCDGHLAQYGDGTLVLTVGKFREELVETITDADILGHFIQHDAPEEDEINRLVPKFTYPATDYTTAVADYFESTADQLKAGRVLSQEADLGWVHSWRQARRLTKREWLRIQEKKRGSLDLRLSAVNAVRARWIRIQSTYRIPRLDGAIIENRRSILSLMEGGFQMEWTKHPADIDAWTPETDEGAAPPVPARPTSSGVPQPTVDSVVAVQSSGIVYLRVVIVDPDRQDLTPVVSWRVKDRGDGSPGAWVDQPYDEWEAVAGLVSLDTAPVPNDQLIEVKVAFRAARGTLGPASDSEEVLAIVDTVAPAALGSFALTGGSVHMGHAPLSFATTNDEHLKKIAIYRVPAGGVLDKDVHFVKRLFGVALGTTFASIDGDATVTNLLSNGDFASDTVWSKGTGWTIGSGKATKTAGTNAPVSQSLSLVDGRTYRLRFRLLDFSGGALSPRLMGSGFVNGVSRTADGYYLDSIVATSATLTGFGLNGNAGFAGSVDDATLYEQTAACAPQGEWDYYAVPENGSGVEGSASGPLAITII